MTDQPATPVSCSTEPDKPEQSVSKRSCRALSRHRHTQPVGPTCAPRHRKPARWRGVSHAFPLRTRSMPRPGCLTPREIPPPPHTTRPAPCHAAPRLLPASYASRASRASCHRSRQVRPGRGEGDWRTPPGSGGDDGCLPRRGRARASPTKASRPAHTHVGGPRRRRVVERAPSWRSGRRRSASPAANIRPRDPLTCPGLGATLFHHRQHLRPTPQGTVFSPRIASSRLSPHTFD